eukprot:TRINITY_DN6104_c0_g1_i1.p2 TRINITY_DN6104_c0_g1~~TRINITY_DN6104_c0_g1_i1.p2  ORF type:complete len:130 (+),score=34.45 TRINITY_DN6104_c0_g1_i1:1381-1770(+)
MDFTFTFNGEVLSKARFWFDPDGRQRAYFQDPLGMRVTSLEEVKVNRKFPLFSFLLPGKTSFLVHGPGGDVLGQITCARFPMKRLNYYDRPGKLVGSVWSSINPFGLLGQTRYNGSIDGSSGINAEYGR